MGLKCPGHRVPDHVEWMLQAVGETSSAAILFGSGRAEKSSSAS